MRDPAGRADYFVALVQGIIAHGQAETALTLSEERLHGIVASALHGIVALDQRRRIATFNPAAEEIFGYRADQVMNLPADFLVPPRLTATYLTHMKVLLAGDYGPDTYPKRNRLAALREDGSELRLEASFSRHASEAGPFITFRISRRNWRQSDACVSSPRRSSRVRSLSSLPTWPAPSSTSIRA